MDLFYLYVEQELFDLVYALLSLFVFGYLFYKAFVKSSRGTLFYFSAFSLALINRIIREGELLLFWILLWLVKVKQKLSNETVCPITQSPVFELC